MCVLLNKFQVCPHCANSLTITRSTIPTSVGPMMGSQQPALPSESYASGQNRLTCRTCPYVGSLMDSQTHPGLKFNFPSFRDHHVLPQFSYGTITSVFWALKRTSSNICSHFRCHHSSRLSQSSNNISSGGHSIARKSTTSLAKKALKMASEMSRMVSPFARLPQLLRIPLSTFSKSLTASSFQ